MNPQYPLFFLYDKMLRNSISIVLSLMFLCLFLSRILATQTSSIGVSVSIIVRPELKLKVYKDFLCTETLSSIDWGVLSPTDKKTYLIFLRNEGNIAFILFLSTDNWNPLEAKNYIYPSWNYDNRTIFPNEVKEISLILQIDSAIQNITEFSFDFIITGESIE